MPNSGCIGTKRATVTGEGLSGAVRIEVIEETLFVCLGVPVVRTKADGESEHAGDGGISSLFDRWTSIEDGEVRGKLDVLKA